MGKVWVKQTGQMEKESLTAMFNHAVTALHEEVATATLKDLELAAARIVEDMKWSYDRFFVDLQKLVMESDISGESPGAPAFFGEIKHNGPKQWPGLSHSWLQRKQRAADDEGPDTMSFYRGITNWVVTRGQRIHPRKPLIEYTSSLASSSASNVAKFFGGMALRFFITHENGKKDVLNHAGQLKTFMLQGRDARGHFLKKLPSIRLTAEITAFPKIAGLKAYDNAPDWQLASYMGSKDRANAPQWLKIRGHKYAHRPVLTPLIQWYLQVHFEGAIKSHLFKGQL